MVSLSLVLMVWILGSMFVVSLCAAAARGDDQLESYRPSPLLDVPDAPHGLVRAEASPSPARGVSDAERRTSERHEHVAA